MTKANQREIRRQARVARQKRQRNIIIASIAGVVILLVALAAISLNNQQAAATSATATAAAQPTPTTAAGMTFPGNVTDATKTASGLQYKDIAVGTGAEAASGKTVTVNYTLWLTDGKKLESSLDSGQPFSFQLGAGRVIPGWDEGVAGMKEGGKRILIIPPALGYGTSGQGQVPPNATLVFEVDLLSVK